MLNYYVTDASLAKFNLTSNNTLLDYNLQLNLTLENPTPLDYNFAWLVAVLVFAGQTLDDNMTDVSKPFNVAHNANVTLPALFVGNHSVALGSQGASDFGKGGVFGIGLKINNNYTLSFDKNKLTSFEGEVTCDLKVSLNSNGTNGGVTFKATECKVVKIDQKN